ncbi:MAG: hypothetical protein QOG62_2538 [Thermoleophilaceae bacterium]|nr:hypothetical protein [Thermoleophilaceae bacterium]
MTFDGSRVVLPHTVRPPFDVFVSGVPQIEGSDYTVDEGQIRFSRELTRDKVGFWRWALMFFSIAGTYGGQTVDVRYSAGGQNRVATGLEILPPHSSP